MVSLMQRRRAMMLQTGGEVIILPAGYTKVSAVGSKFTGSPSHTMQVDTGIVATNNTRIYVKFRYVGSKSNANNIIGSSNASNGEGGVIVFLIGLRWQSGALFWSNPSAGNTYELEAWRDGSGAHFRVNGVDNVGTSPGNPTATETLYLLGRNQRGSMYGSSPACMVYRMKIWENGVLVRDFIPCLRDSDSKAGFYDIANSQYYTRMSGTTSALEYEV